MEKIQQEAVRDPFYQSSFRTFEIQGYRREWTSSVHSQKIWYYWKVNGKYQEKFQEN